MRRNTQARGYRSEINKSIAIIAAAAAGSLWGAGQALAQNSWTGGGADDFWSTGLNWSTGNPPLTTEQVRFGNVDAQGAPGTVNNIVSSNITIGSLFYSNLASVGFHTTQIDPGVTLSIAHTGAVSNMLHVGTGTNVGAGAQLNYTITGGGTLALTGTNGVVMVRQGATANGTHTATLDLRALTNFTADINRIAIGAEGDATIVNFPHGTMYLAQNNVITARNTNDGITIGDAAQNPSSNRSALYMGQSNVFNLNRLEIASRKSEGLLTWQSGLVNPTLTVRGIAGGTNRVGAILVGDNNGTGATGLTARGLADLNDGAVDILADLIIVGRGFNATAAQVGSAFGHITWNNGTINANTVLLGVHSNTRGNGAGTITVNTGATFIINTLFEMGRKNASNPEFPGGVFEIFGGTVNNSGNIADGGGSSAINMTGGLLDMKPAGDLTAGNIGTIASPVDQLSLTGGTIANAGNIVVSNISGAGAITGLTGTLTVDSPNTNTFSGSIGGTGNISKSNFASLTLDGSLNYTGATTVHGGTLVLGATTSLSNSASIDVKSGAILDASAGGLAVGAGRTLTGAGTILGTVSAGGATITPGGALTPGTLSTGALTLDNSALTLDLQTPGVAGSGVNDLINVTGDLTLSGVTNVSLNGLGGALASGTYRIIDFTGNLAGGAANLAIAGAAAGSRRTFAFDTATANQVNLIVGGTDPLALTWSGGVNGRWNFNGDANWNSNTEKFFNLDTVTFDDSGTAQANVELVGDLAPAAVTVSSSGNYTFSGAGRITGGALLTQGGTGMLTFANSGANELAGGIVINSGTVRVSAGGADGNLGVGPVTNNASLVFNRSDDFTAANSISGSGTIEKLGAGVLTLSGNSAFSGPVLINQGTLRPAAATSLGDTNSGAITIAAGATLDVNSVNLGAKIVSAQGAGVGGAGAIVNNGPADQVNALQFLTLAGDTTLGGTARWDVRAVAGSGSLNGGGFNLTKTGSNRISLAGLGDTVLGDIAINDGILAFDGTTTQGILSNTITIAAPGTLGYLNTGANLLNKNIVSNGGRLLSENGANLQSGSVTVNLDTTLDITAGTLTLFGEVNGAGGLIKNGAGELLLNGTATYAGTTTVNMGFVRGNVNSLQGNFILNNTGNGVVFQETAEGSSRASFSGVGNIFAGVLLTNIVSLVLPNSHEGFTIVNGGGFRAMTPTAFGGTMTGTFLDGGTRTGSVQLAGSITTAAEELRPVGRAAGNNVAHLSNFEGNNTWSGNITTAVAADAINLNQAGTIYILESSAGSLTIGGNVSNNIIGAAGTNVGVLQLQGASNGQINGVIGGSAPGSMAVTKIGAGTWTLAGANTYTGATTVNEGTLRVSGSVSNSASVTVNSTFEADSTQTIKTLTVNTGATARVTAGGNKVLTIQSDTIALAGGTLDLNGGLVVDYTAGNTPFTAIRDAIVAGYNTGTWDGVGIHSSVAATTPNRAVGYGESSTLLGGGGGDFMGQTVDGDALLARLTVLGDTNLDGSVGFVDLLKVAANFGTSGVFWTDGDINYDGAVTFVDLLAVAANFGGSLPASIPGASGEFNEALGVAAAQVPEPGAIGLIALAAGAMTPRRRRKEPAA